MGGARDDLGLGYLRRQKRVMDSLRPWLLSLELPFLLLGRNTL